MLGSMASAATLTFRSDPGGNTFFYSVNGSQDIIQMVCLDYHARIPYPVVQVDVMEGLPTDNSQDSINLRAAAIAWSYVGDGYSAVTAQYAVWQLTDSRLNFGSPASRELMNLALTLAVNPTIINSGFFSQFTVYSPVGYSGNNSSSFQRMMEGPWWGPPPDPNAVPEPATLSLIGVGLMAIPLARRLRRKA